ncbi:MAG: ABC transporter substrate binding protein [Sulfuricurvum sp.]|uniref:ABC transporter substrate binding protein n=1 Tax=Sulfuricurvum sp. TaxID=2025608 RepID=UPI00261E4B64|nr:ABC transporter substrate binding protein [Sulfuricurvum sp.]MDD5117633.1 ABC transporter substrate binding protein [Sulfuricurvum sp.]
MLHNKEKIFPSVPVIFSGVNDLSKQKMLDESQYTGIFEKKEILPNLNLITKLFPDEREVLVVGDGSTTAQVTQNEIKNDTLNYGKIKIEFSNDQDFDSLLQRLKSYKGKAVILTSIGTFRTHDGQLINLNHVLKQIKDAGSYIVLSLEDSYIQQGVLGGYVVDGNAQGTEAGKLALSILSHPKLSIPIFHENTNKWIFDAVALKQHAILLPSDIGSQSIFINPPQTFFKKHQETLINLLYALSITTVIVSFLFALYMYQSRKILLQRKQALLKVSESLNQAQMIAHLGNWEWDIKANTLWWSDEIYRIFGLLPQQFEATYEGFLERVHPDDQEKVQEAVNKSLVHNIDYSVEHRIVKSDGMIRYVLEEGNTEWDDLGNPLRMRGVIHDITEEKSAQILIEKSEKKYRNLVENAMIGIYRADLSGKIIYVNHALTEILGFDSPEDLIGQDSSIRYAQPEQRNKLIQILQKEGHVANMEIELLDKYSVAVPVMISATVEGETFSGILMDMRELKRSRFELDKLSKVIEQIDDAVVITDRHGKITYVNQAFLHQTGYEKYEVLNKTLTILKSGKQSNEFYKELWRTILKGNVFRGTIINIKKNGDLYYENKTITPMKDEKGDIVSFVSSGKDVTQENLLNQEIQRIASIDNLTGIYNRHKFEALFELETERSKRFSLPLSMILIDIDYFKSINDAYGHDVGDEVLQHLVKVIESNIRKLDIFARWGGEEFLILCPGIDLNNVHSLAEKLRIEVEKAHFPLIDTLTISIGISTFNENDTISSLFKRADQGLYNAKGAGRNRVGEAIPHRSD